MSMGRKDPNPVSGSALDPQIQELLLKNEREGVPPWHTLTPEEARRGLIERAKELRGAPDPVADIQDLTIPGPAGEIPIRVYKPEGGGPFPILIYFHGGGWVIGDLDTHDHICRFFANRASCVVVSVYYRLAPENKFPAAVEDAYSATQWVADNAEVIKGDMDRIAVGGDSAGGNLTAVVTLMAQERGGPKLIYQLLIYPVTDLSSMHTGSYNDFSEGYSLMKADMQWFRDHYLKTREDRFTPYASPLLSQELKNLPPALIITAEFDVLRDEAEAYANKLKEANIPVKYIRYDGMIHGFMGMDGVVDRTKEAIDETVTALRQAFHTKKLDK